VGSIITEQQHLKAQRILDISLIKLIPKGSFLLGIISVGASIILLFNSERKSKPKNKN
jgi:hypothetical protein